MVHPTPLNNIVIALSLVVGLAASLEAGFRLGRRAVQRTGGDPTPQLGAVQGAILGLLGLLLGFSFSGASGRFMERQDLVVQDSNAISTAFLRAELLDEPHRTRVCEQLGRALDARLEITDATDAAGRAAGIAVLDECHARLWSAAAEGVAAKPAATLAVLPPVNEVIDMQTTRIGASAKHLPALVLWLLVACSALAMGVIGYGCGLSRARSTPMTLPLALIVAASLWAIMDLERSRGGLIRIDDTALTDLQRAYRRDASLGERASVPDGS
jgi:hypothetical protein